MSENSTIVVPEDVEQIPKVGVKAYIEALAHQHGIVYKRTALDALAKTFSRLSDKEVPFDLTQALLVRILKAQIITGRQAARLLHNYMEEQDPTTDDAQA